MYMHQSSPILILMFGDTKAGKIGEHYHFIVVGIRSLEYIFLTLKITNAFEIKGTSAFYDNCNSLQNTLIPKFLISNYKMILLSC